MLVFIDVVDPSGRYQPGWEPAFAHPDMPARILLAAVLLEDGSVPSARIFHVEGGVYLGPDTLGGAGVGELDTLIIVNCDRLGVGDPDQLALGWHVIGGVTRRTAHAGLGRRRRPTAPIAG